MSHELQFERVIDAEPEVVFDALTDPGGQAAFYRQNEPGWRADTGDGGRRPSTGRPRAEEDQARLDLEGGRPRHGAEHLRGHGPPSTFSVSFDIFNDKNQLIFVAKQPDTGMVIQASRSTIQDGTITTNIAATPGGPPDGQSSVQSIHFQLKQVTTTRDGAVASYLTTPPTCPSSGLWTSTGTFTYADGISQTIEPTTPCLSAQQPGAGTQGGQRHFTRRHTRHHRARRAHTQSP